MILHDAIQLAIEECPQSKRVKIKNKEVMMWLLENWTPELREKRLDVCHQILCEMCDHEFEKLQNGEDNFYEQMSELVKKRRIELKLIDYTKGK